MFHCEVCSYSSQSVKSYVLHYRLHRHQHNVDFPCGYKECSRRFKKYTTFKSHLQRDHASKNPHQTSATHHFSHHGLRECLSSYGNVWNWSFFMSSCLISCLYIIFFNIIVLLICIRILKCMIFLKKNYLIIKMKKF